MPFFHPELTFKNTNKHFISRPPPIFCPTLSKCSRIHDPDVNIINMLVGGKQPEQRQQHKNTNFVTILFISKLRRDKEREKKRENHPERKREKTNGKVTE